MVGIVNFVEKDSKGVQIGLLNSRLDVPWYAKVILGIAIRFKDSEKDSKKDSE